MQIKPAALIWVSVRERTNHWGEWTVLSVGYQLKSFMLNVVYHLHIGEKIVADYEHD